MDLSFQALLLLYKMRKTPKQMKYFKTSVILLLFSCVYLSCKESSLKESTKIPTYEVQPYAAHIFLDSDLDSQSIPGIYQGIFPCTACEGMQQILFLKNNFTYKQTYINVDSNKVYSTSTGEWKIEDNRIILSKDNDYYITFIQRNDSLFAVDIDRIPLRNPESYGLARQKYSGDDPYWEAEKKKGISFAGRGTDPSWLLNIKNEVIYFKLKDHKNMVISEKVKTESSDSEITYHLSTNNKPWRVTIKNLFNKNGLSGDIYEYEVLVNYDGREYYGHGIDLRND
jgi:uncharacterized membrane protein